MYQTECWSKSLLWRLVLYCSERHDFVKRAWISSEEEENRDGKGTLSEAFPSFVYFSISQNNWFTFYWIFFIIIIFYFYFGFDFKWTKWNGKIFKILKKKMKTKFILFFIITIRYYIACPVGWLVCCLIVILIASITPRFKVKCLW